MAFRKATKFESKARIALIGPSGSGKSYTALSIASGLGERVAAIDTEHGSLSKYSDVFSFDVDELQSFEPQRYIDAMAAAEADYDVLVVDSLSHAWVGRGGLLEQVDKAAARKGGDNTFTAWRDATPQHLALIEAIHTSKLHLVCTMRSKMEYVLEANDRGKMVPRKVGLAPVQREGLDFEFDIVGEMNQAHTMNITKTRIATFDGAEIAKPGRAFGDDVRLWLAGEKRLEPWETEQFVIGELAGTLVSEAQPGTIERYIMAVEHHVKTHPELSRADKDQMRAHYARCKQALEHAKTLPPPTEPEKDGWNLSPDSQQ